MDHKCNWPNVWSISHSNANVWFRKRRMFSSPKWMKMMKVNGTHVQAIFEKMKVLHYFSFGAEIYGNTFLINFNFINTREALSLFGTNFLHLITFLMYNNHHSYFCNVQQCDDTTIQAVALQPAVLGISCQVLLPSPCNDSACTYHSAIFVKPQQWHTPSESIAIYCERKLVSCVTHLQSSTKVDIWNKKKNLRTVAQIKPQDYKNWTLQKFFTIVDQFTLLKQDIEDTFSAKKGGVVFVHLIAAYDIVWHRGLTCKLLQSLPDRHMVHMIMEMVGNRSFALTTVNSKRSRLPCLNNGIPQASFLDHHLFNIYISDLRTTVSIKYANADNLAIMHADEYCQAVEGVLTEDMATVDEYLQTWKLSAALQKRCRQPSTLTSTQLNVSWAQSQLQQRNPVFFSEPKYLGVTQDRSLTYRRHLESLRKKLTSRVALLVRLAGSGWGAGATALRTATFALVHSTAEHCAPDWSRSAHARLTNPAIKDAFELWLDACVLHQRTTFQSSQASNCWASSQWSRTVFVTPCHGAWTSAPLNALQDSAFSSPTPEPILWNDPPKKSLGPI